MKKILLLTLTLNFVLFAGLTAAVSKKSKDIILIPKELEVSIGRGAAREVETKFKVLNDPELTAYIDKVGQRIAQVCDRQNLNMLIMRIVSTISLEGTKVIFPGMVRFSPTLPVR